MRVLKGLARFYALAVPLVLLVGLVLAARVENARADGVNPGTVDGYIATFLAAHGVTVGATSLSGFTEADTLDSVMERGATASVGAQVSITATGAGNDIALTAADDVQVSAGDVSLSGTSSVSLASGSAGLDVFNTTDDVTVQADGTTSGTFSGSGLDLGSLTLTSGAASVGSVTVSTGLDVGPNRIALGASTGSPDVHLVRPSASTVRVARGTADATFGDLELGGLLAIGPWGMVPGGASASGVGVFANAARAAQTVTTTASAVGPYTSLASSTAANNTVTWLGSGNAAMFRIDNLPRWIQRWAVQDVVECRLFVGLSSSSTAADPVTAADPSGVKTCGVMFDTSRGDVNLMWVEDDDATQTVTTTNVGLVVGTAYFLDIEATSTTSITLTLRDATWAQLATRTVTSPFTSTAGCYACCAFRNLGSTDTKEFDLYQGEIRLGVGRP